VSFDFLKTAIEPLLAPEIYRTVLDAMTDQIKAIKMDRVAISFTPRHVAYEAENNKVFVSGELKSQSYKGVPETLILAYFRKDLFRLRLMTSYVFHKLI
jgi:conjugal transfer pilus assembly protein TraE